MSQSQGSGPPATNPPPHLQHAFSTNGGELAPFSLRCGRCSEGLYFLWMTLESSRADGDISSLAPLGLGPPHPVTWVCVRAFPGGGLQHCAHGLGVLAEGQGGEQEQDSAPGISPHAASGLSNAL